MRAQLVMAERAGAHPHRLMTRVPHAQRERIRVVVPPTHAGKGTPWTKVQRLLQPTHTQLHRWQRAHHRPLSHLSTKPTYPDQGTRPYRKQSGPAIGNATRAVHAHRTKDVSNPSSQGVHRQVRTRARNGRSPQSAHSSKASGCPQSACMLARPPERVGRASHKKSLIYFLLWFANSSVAGAPDKRAQWAAATAAQTAGRSPRPSTRSTRGNKEGQVGEQSGHVPSHRTKGRRVQHTDTTNGHRASTWR